MAGLNDPPGGPTASRPATDAELAKRLNSLSRAIDAETRERAEAERPKRADSAGYALAFRLGSEFIAAVLVGAGLGWALDRLAGTSPWGLIVLLLLGFAAGVMNVMRAAGVTATAAAKTPADRQGGPH